MCTIYCHPPDVEKLKRNFCGKEEKFVALNARSEETEKEAYMAKFFAKDSKIEDKIKEENVREHDILK